MEKRTKEQAIESIKGAISSIFSKEDVIAIINSIEEPKSLPFVADDLAQDITDKLRVDRVIDFDSAEFALDGKEISLEEIEFDDTELRGHVYQIIIEHIENNI